MELQNELNYIIERFKGLKDVKEYAEKLKKFGKYDDFLTRLCWDIARASIPFEIRNSWYDKYNCDDTDFTELYISALKIAYPKIYKMGIKKNDMWTNRENQNMNFRDVEHKLCLVFEPNQIIQLYNDKQAVDANCFICYGYVDHSAGLTYQVLGMAKYVDGDYICMGQQRGTDFKIRADEMLEKIQIIPIQNKAIEELYAREIGIIKEGYYKNLAVIKTRTIKSIDEYRHKQYPDDVLVDLIAENIKPERVWVRLSQYKQCDDGNYIREFFGELLNKPYNAGFGLTRGDKVVFYEYKTEQGIRLFCVRIK